MATCASHGENGERKKVVLSALPRGMVNILSEAEVKPKTVIIDNLQNIIDEEYLREYRDTLFTYTKERLSDAIKGRSGDLTGVISLELAKRRKPKKLYNYSKDIYEMFVYAVGLEDDFPKEILSSNCEFVEFKDPPIDTENMYDQCTLQREIILMKSTVGKLNTLVVKLVNKVEDQKKQIDLSRTKMADLDRKIETLLRSKNVIPGSPAVVRKVTRPATNNSGELLNVIPNSQTPSQEGSLHDLDMNISVIPETQLMDHEDSINSNHTSQLGLSQDGRMDIQGEAVLNTPLRSTPVRQLNTPASASATSNVSIDSSSSGHQSVTPFSLTRHDDEDSNAAERRTGGSPSSSAVSESSETDIDASCRITAFQPPPTPPTIAPIALFSDIIQKEGRWKLTPKARRKMFKNIKRSQNENIHANINSHTDHRSKAEKNTGAMKLEGAPSTNTSLMYVKNIKMQNGLSPNDIVILVKEHAKSIGLNVSFARMITNKVSKEVVGCLIKVPKHQISLAEDKSQWPKPIFCRIWESDSKRNTAPSGVNRDSKIHGGGTYRHGMTSRDDDWWNYGHDALCSQYGGGDGGNYILSNYDMEQGYTTNRRKDYDYRQRTVYSKQADREGQIV